MDVLTRLGIGDDLFPKVRSTAHDDLEHQRFLPGVEEGLKDRWFS